MSRITWFRFDHGWRAGPYDIELAAPRLWVCTRRAGPGDVELVMTSGSLKSLKRRVARLEERRQGRRRSLGYFAGALASTILAVAVGVADFAFASFLMIVLTGFALFTALRAIDCVINRSWESIRQTYQ